MTEADEWQCWGWGRHSLAHCSEARKIYEIKIESVRESSRERREEGASYRESSGTMKIQFRVYVEINFSVAARRMRESEVKLNFTSVASTAAATASSEVDMIDFWFQNWMRKPHSHTFAKFVTSIIGNLILKASSNFHRQSLEVSYKFN